MPRPDLPPILLGEVREAGLTLHVRCCGYGCGHTVDIPVSALALPADLDMVALGDRMRCTRCGRAGGNSVYPDQRSWVRHLRATGQRRREPWFAGMMGEDG